MADLMLALGPFRFSVDSLAAERLTHRRAYRWAAQPRLGERAALQYLGEGEEQVTLGGRIYPHYRGGLGQATLLAALAGAGVPQPLVSATGVFWGFFALVRVDQEQQRYFPGGVPRRLQIELTLRRYADGDLLTNLQNALQGAGTGLIDALTSGEAPDALRALTRTISS